VGESPCIGLDPDTDPCPFCGASASDGCSAEQGLAWRIDPNNDRHLEVWKDGQWTNDCWLTTPLGAQMWLAENIREVRA
jgi:hypothetical protein